MREPPELPKPPIGMIIKDGSVGRCVRCGSSTKWKWLFFNIGCIHPKCENYFEKNEEAKRKLKEENKEEIKPIDIMHKR